MGRQHSQEFDTAIGRIRGEMKRSVDEHGPLTTRHHRALAIIVKELGEVAEDVNLLELRPDVVHQILENLKSELAQVAQLCCQFIMNIEEAEAAAQHFNRGAKKL